jgi:hypothetical protein
MRIGKKRRGKGLKSKHYKGLRAKCPLWETFLKTTFYDLENVRFEP